MERQKGQLGTMFQHLMKKRPAVAGMRCPVLLPSIKSKMENDTPGNDEGGHVPGHGSPLMAKIPRGRGAPFPVWGMGRRRGVGAWARREGGSALGRGSGSVGRWRWGCVCVCVCVPGFLEPGSDTTLRLRGQALTAGLRWQQRQGEAI